MENLDVDIGPKRVKESVFLTCDLFLSINLCCHSC